MRRCLLTLLQIFAPARRSWFGLCDMVKICRAGFKAASSLRATHASPSHSQPRTPEGEAMRGTPKKRGAFFGDPPLRIGYHVRRSPDCACNPGRPAPGMRLFRHSRADDVTSGGNLCPATPKYLHRRTYLRTQPAGTQRFPSLLRTRRRFALETVMMRRNAGRRINFTRSVRALVTCRKPKPNDLAGFFCTAIRLSLRLGAAVLLDSTQNHDQERVTWTLH
jgi:hypothetical protein